MPTNYTFDLEPKILAMYPNLTSSEVTTIATDIKNSSDPLVDPADNLKAAIVEVCVIAGFSLAGKV